MTQPDVAAAIRRIQDEARRVAVPLVTDAEEQAWERYKQQYALPLIAALVAALVAQRITPREFEAAMLQQIRQSRQFAFAVTRGGLDGANKFALTPADRQRIETRVSVQARFLTAWVASMALTGGVLTVKGRATTEALQQARAAMYLDASGAELWAGKAAAVGMPDLPAWPRDGQTRCLRACYCGWWIQQVGESDWDAYWMLNWTGFPEIHCEHCPRRALAWSPLKIRGGILQPYLKTGLFL